MKQYPSIPGVNGQGSIKGLPCIAFKKYDGSNLRFEWQIKKGWHLFGTRKRLFDHSDPEFGSAIEIFQNKYALEIEKLITKNKYFRGVKEVICFCEFFGPSSFAGHHHPTETKDLILFDIHLHKKGLVPPRDFIKLFNHLEIAEVVYDGNLNQSFIEDVQQSKYPVFEGVVCKGVHNNKLWMTKIKTFTYLEELKKRFSKDYQQYWE